MRWAVMVLVLVLVGVAGAEDDDAVLDMPSLGDPIPERMQTLEKEWDDDVGTKDHAVAPADETDPFERNAEPTDEPDVEVAKPAAPTDEPADPPKRASTLEQPLARDPPSKPTAIPPAKATGKAPPETSAERRAADLKDAN